MLSWFHRFMPREELFFPLFNRHAALLTSASTSLRQMLEGGPKTAEHFAEVMHYEQQADEVAREVFIGIRSSFITPFDRGDIKNLVTSMDDAIDQMQKTAKAVVLFEMTSFEPEMQAMGDAILESAKLVEQAVPLLSAIGPNAAKLNDLCLQITRIEGRADEMHDRGLKSLYVKAKAGSPMDFIRGNEIFDHLEKSADRFDDVANQIQGIVIEQV